MNLPVYPKFRYTIRNVRSKNKKITANKVLCLNISNAYFPHRISGIIARHPVNFLRGINFSKAVSPLSRHFLRRQVGRSNGSEDKSDQAPRSHSTGYICINYRGSLFYGRNCFGYRSSGSAKRAMHRRGAPRQTGWEFRGVPRAPWPPGTRGCGGSDCTTATIIIHENIIGYVFLHV